MCLLTYGTRADPAVRGVGVVAHIKDAQTLADDICRPVFEVDKAHYAHGQTARVESAGIEPEDQVPVSVVAALDVRRVPPNDTDMRRDRGEPAMFSASQVYVCISQAEVPASMFKECCRHGVECFLKVRLGLRFSLLSCAVWF